MDTIKSIWTSYKRSIIAFLLGALMTIIYSLTGYKFEVKDVTPDAPAAVEAPAVPTTGVIGPMPKVK